MDNLSVYRGFHQFVGMIEPVRVSLKMKKKDLASTLSEIKHYQSIIGIARRFFGNIQERKVLHTITLLPKIGHAIADDLQGKAERFYELRGSQLTYVRDVNGHIGGLLDSRVPETDTRARDQEYRTLLQRLRTKDMKETHQAHSHLFDSFEDWSERSIQNRLQEEALGEYHSFREEALFNLIACNYVYENLRLISDSVQRKVSHLDHVLELHKEIIVLGRDMVSVRKGLVEVAEKGSMVYETVRESYARLEDMMKELRNPTTLLS